MPDTALPPALHRDAQGQLWMESVALTHIAEQFGTPAYVYSRSALTEAYQSLTEAFGQRAHQICFAVKANSNLAILNLLARQGAGFDIVSGGELARVLKAGANPATVVFSGVGKTADELRDALKAGIGCINVESEAELAIIGTIATELAIRAPISLRVNPDVDAQTHPYISTGLKENKFGIDIQAAAGLYQKAAEHPWLEIVGVDCHIGSQLTDTSPFSAAAERVLKLVHELDAMGIDLKHLDLGGGLGIRYTDETPPSAVDWVQSLCKVIDADPIGRNLPIWIEPGRYIAGPAGVMLTQTLYTKPSPHKSFAIVDAAMNDLMRPALYQSEMAIIPIAPSTATPQLWDIVGPVCETGDFLGKDRRLAVNAGDVFAVLGAGAYGFSMASNYNSRPRPVELLVDGEQVHVIRERESQSSLWQGERIPGE